MAEYLRKLFPDLQDFTVTSPTERRYNCIAWAAGKSDRRWWPHPDAYWPLGDSVHNDISAFVEAFASFGYEACDDGDLEDGFEKVVIYAIPPAVSHMARQLPTGRWTSKLGDLEDIEHASPFELEGSAYGIVVQYLRRSIVDALS